MSSPWWLVAAFVAGAVIGTAFAALLPRLMPPTATAHHWTGPAPTGVLIATTGALFALLAWSGPTGGALLAAWCLAAVAVPLTVLDLAVRRLPNALVGPAYAAATVILATTGVHSGPFWSVARAMLCSATVSGAMLLLALALPGQLGLGDVKLAALTALVTGAVSITAATLAIVGAFASAGIVAAALLVMGRTTRHHTTPFGPYLLGAALATLLISPL